jgi:hypothetical protein
MVIDPTPAEQQRRDEVMRRILECIRTETRIKLPVFDPALDRPTDQFALLSIGLEPNDFSGSIGSFRYQFEGEDSQAVAAFVLNGMPSALIWLRPGEYSTHFYFGHDELLKHLVV